jgi:capsular exopolysaccharide synthesis family protein
MSEGLLNEERGSQAGEYLSALRRRWLLILASVVLAAWTAVIFVVTADKKYESEADVRIIPFSDSTGAFEGINFFRDPSSSIYAAGQIMTTPAATDAVIDRLGLDTSRDDLLDKVKIKPMEQSGIVAIIAEAGSAAGAAELANTFADVFVERRTNEFQAELKARINQLEAELDQLGAEDTDQKRALENQLASLKASVGSADPTVELLSEAVPPDSPSWPRPMLSLVVAILAALLLAVGGVLILATLDPRMSSEDELLRHLPVLARIPRAPGRVVRSYLRGKGPLPADLWEGYRTLRANLAARGVGGESPRAVLVTSAIKAEGKTMTSANLAKALAAGGLRVILVDADFRRPAVGAIFDRRETGGLADLLFGRTSVDEALVDAPGYGDWLRLLLPGEARPIDLLEPRRIADIIDQLKSAADVVVVDSPPLTEFADAFSLADAVDIVLIAVRLGHSRRDRFAELNRFLSQHAVTTVGLVVTSRHRSRGAGLTPTTESVDTVLPSGEVSRESGAAASADG